jgi:hypothetical protein
MDRHVPGGPPEEEVEAEAALHQGVPLPDHLIRPRLQGPHRQLPGLVRNDHRDRENGGEGIGLDAGAKGRTGPGFPPASSRREAGNARFTRWRTASAEGMGGSIPIPSEKRRRPGETRVPPPSK